MGIQKDAGELLVYIYDRLVEKNKSSVNGEEVLKETKWEANRINRAFDYLKDLNLFQVSQGIGNFEGVYNFFIMRLYPGGINIVENEPEFKKNFGFEVGIPGVFKFSWGASEQ